MRVVFPETDEKNGRSEVAGDVCLAGHMLTGTVMEMNLLKFQTLKLC